MTTEAAVSAPTAQSERSRQPRRRHWWLRIFVGLVILAVIVLIAVELVLNSDLPRKLVLGQIEKQLGLRVTADSLSTGWLGHTSLQNVAISLPMSENAFFTAPKLKVDHTTILGLILTRSVSLQRVELDHPTLNVVQDAQGNWNVLRAVELVGRALGKEPAKDEAKKDPRPSLPAVQIDGLTLNVIDNAGKRASVAPINLVGRPEDALTYRYDLQAPPENGSPDAARLAVVGRVAPGGDWAHEVALTLAHPEKWAVPWVGPDVPAAELAAQWHGQLSAAGGGGVVGQLDLQRATYGNLGAHGTLALSQQGAELVAQPQNLVVTTGQALPPQVQLRSGQIIANGKTIKVQELIAAALDGVARVDGDLDIAGQSGHFAARWDRLLVGTAIAHSGQVSLELKTSFPNRPEIHVGLQSTGYDLKAAAATQPGPLWQADVSVDGNGANWQNIDWRLDAKRLAYTNAEKASLDGLALTISQTPQRIRLNSISLPGEHTIRSQADYDLASRNWSADFSVLDANLPMPWGGRSKVNLTLTALGTPAQITGECYLRGAEAEISATGQYVMNKPKPVDLDVKISHIPPRLAEQDLAPVYGFLRGVMHLTGTAAPLDLEVTGDLQARQFAIANHAFGDISARIKNASVVAGRFLLETEEVKLLNGDWALVAQYPGPDNVLDVALRVKNLPLAQSSQMLLNRQDISGMADGVFTLSVPKPDVNQMSLKGGFVVRDLAAPGVVAERVQANVQLANGLLSVSPLLVLAKAQESDQGKVEASLDFDVQTLKRAHLDAKVTSWPVFSTPTFAASVSGNVTDLTLFLPGSPSRDPNRGPVEYDVNQVRAKGKLAFDANLRLKGEPLGTASITAGVDGRVIEVPQIKIDTLQGKGDGSALIDLDRLLETTAHVVVHDVNAAEIIDYFPDKERLVGLEGLYSGELVVGPAKQTHALEPLGVHVRVLPRRARYRAVHLGDMVFNFYTDLKDRLVMQQLAQPVRVGHDAALIPPALNWLESPSVMKIANGSILMWGRLTRHQPVVQDNVFSPAKRVPTWISLLEFEFDHLNLNQLVQAADPTAEPMIGNLAGHFRIGGSTRVEPRVKAERLAQEEDPLEKLTKRLTAEGSVRITESNLLNLDVVSALYGLMNVGADMSGPSGRGRASFRMENGTFALTQMRYFNLGTEIRATASVQDVWKMPQSPLSGSAVALARPLKNFKIPFMEVMSLDQIFSALQSNLTSVQIGGTVKEPTIAPISFAQIGTGLKAIFAGDVNSQVQGSASE